MNVSRQSNVSGGAGFSTALARPAEISGGQTGDNDLLARWNGCVGARPRLAAGVLFAMTTLVFRGVLACGFVFDDSWLILQNPAVTAPGRWRRIFFGSIWSQGGTTDYSHFYRPLEILCYRVVYSLVGANPVWFHLVQLACYASTVCLIFYLARKLLRHDLAAFVGALLWGLHPLHVETAAWVSGLGDACSALLVIVSFVLFLRAEGARHSGLAAHVLAAASYFCALLFKESALCFPALLLAYWFFKGGKELWTSRLRRWLPYAIATVAYMALRTAALGRHTTAAQPWHVSGLTVAAAAGALGQEAKLFVWPVHLCLLCDFNLSASLRSPWPWLTLAALAATIIFRPWHALAAFLLAWWGLALLPCLDYRQLVGSPAAERFAYLPSVGPCLALAFGALAVAPRHMPRVRVYLLALPALLVIGALWTFQDVRTIPNWRSEDALCSHAAAEEPDSAYAHKFHAMALEYQAGDLAGAAREYQAALRITLARLRPLTGMIYECNLGLGRIAFSQNHTQQAINYFQAAITCSPNKAQAQQSLGMVYFSLANYPSAAEHIGRAVQIDPGAVESRFVLGTCWRKLGKLAQAAEQFHAAREEDPTYFQAYLAEAAVLEAMGDKAEAKRVRAEMPAP